MNDKRTAAPDSTAVRVALWRALHVQVDPPPHVFEDEIGLQLAASGFDANRPVVVASTGVSMYLTKDATLATLRQIATLAPGSTLAMTFLLPLDLADPEVRPGLQLAEKGARANGTPFISFFTPTEMLTLAREAGFREVQHVSAATLAQRYFAGRTDGLRPPNNSEELLVATT
jgi:O-methyltransferase involved in polyketide biosynthesis